MYLQNLETQNPLIWIFLFHCSYPCNSHIYILYAFNLNTFSNEQGREYSAAMCHKYFMGVQGGEHTLTNFQNEQ